MLKNFTFPLTFLVAIFLLQTVLTKDINPVKDSFILTNSSGFTSSELVLLIWDAEQAKANNPSNLFSMAFELGMKILSKHGIGFNCMVSYGPTNYWVTYEEYFVNLHSDSGDNMYIDCFKSQPSIIVVP